MATDYTDDDFIFDTHWRALKRAVAGDCIIIDGGITPGTGMQIVLGAMEYSIAGTKYTETGQTLALAAADPTYDRWVLVLGASSGTPKVKVVNGVAGAIPRPPDLPSDETLLGMVYVPAGTTQVLAAHIRSFGFINTYRSHVHDGTYTPNIDINNLNPKIHGLSDITFHSSSTLALLNALISDATLDDITGTRTPISHGNAFHTNRTRVIPVNILTDNFQPAINKATLGAVSGVGANGWAFPNSGNSDNSATFGFSLPADLVTGSANGILSVDLIYWVPSGSGDVVVNYNAVLHEVGSGIDLINGSGVTHTIVAGSFQKLNIPRAGIFPSGIHNSGEIVILRASGAGGDTFTGTFYVVGLLINYVADM